MLVSIMLIALLGFQSEGIDGFTIETLCFEQVAQLSETPQDAKGSPPARYSDQPVATPQTPPGGLERAILVQGPGPQPDPPTERTLGPRPVAVLSMTGLTLLYLLHLWMRRKQ
jgi:hypothetical protein